MTRVLGRKQGFQYCCSLWQEKGIYAKWSIVTGSICIKNQLYYFIQHQSPKMKEMVDTQREYGNVAEPLQVL